jgi:hypothetical protein
MKTLKTVAVILMLAACALSQTKKTDLSPETIAALIEGGRKDITPGYGYVMVSVVYRKATFATVCYVYAVPNQRTEYEVINLTRGISSFYHRTGYMESTDGFSKVWDGSKPYACRVEKDALGQRGTELLTAGK